MAFAVLWVAIESFKEKGKTRFYLEENLAVNYEVTYVQNGVWREVKRCETIIRQDSPKEVGTRRAETPGTPPPSR